MHEICSADSQQIITKIVASRCHILKLKGTKFEFGWGFILDPTGELQRSPKP